MTRRKALLFYQMIQRYKFHKAPDRKEEKRKNETVAVTISFYLYRDLFFSVATELLFVGFWRCVGDFIQIRETFRVSNGCTHYRMRLVTRWSRDFIPQNPRP